MLQPVFPNVDVHEVSPETSTNARIGTLLATRRVAILACMDARIPLLEPIGAGGVDAHVIRNAGARATNDAIQSLLLSHRLFGASRWLVVHHTRCGMAMLSDDIVENAMASGPGAGPHVIGHAALGSTVAGRISIREDSAHVISAVARIRSHRQVPSDVLIYGYLFDAESGHFHEVATSSVRKEKWL